MFYESNVNKVPDKFSELLTSRGLAFWLMDDGSKHGSGMHITVYGFTNEDVDKLMFTLQEKFNLNCSIHYNKDKNLVFIYLKNLWGL